MKCEMVKSLNQKIILENRRAQARKTEEQKQKEKWEKYVKSYNLKNDANLKNCMNYNKPPRKISINRQRNINKLPEEMPNINELGKMVWKKQTIIVMENNKGIVKIAKVCGIEKYTADFGNGITAEMEKKNWEKYNYDFVIIENEKYNLEEFLKMIMRNGITTYELV